MTDKLLDCQDVQPQSSGCGWPKPPTPQSVNLIYELGKTPSDELVYELLLKESWKHALEHLCVYEEKLLAKLNRVQSVKQKLKEVCDETVS